MNTRRRFTLVTPFTLLGFTLLLFVAEPMLADDRHLYVDANASYNGDGSRHHPYWRITDAVVRARALRQEDRENDSKTPEDRNDNKGKIVIHVLPGTYAGSYDPDRLAANPRLELLPIILNVSNLNLAGGTELDEDARGLPTGTYPPDSETLLTTADVTTGLLRGQMLLLIATTTDGMAGNEVSVSGFVMDAQAQDLAGVRGLNIYADRVSDFAIHRNLLRHATVGAQTRLASGTFEANFVGPNNAATEGTGIHITGGSVIHPARVTVRRNRSTQNSHGAALHALANFLELKLGSNTLKLEPLQMSFDINNPKDQQNVPGRLEVAIEGNDFSNNSFVGLRCGFYPPFFYTTADATQPVTGTLDVIVRDNELNRNFDYGITVDPANARRSNSRRLTGRFEGTFEHNSLIDNGRNASVFGFTSLNASTGRAPRQDFKYVQGATFQVEDLDWGFRRR
ncbi:MAG TPA: hypothetical protein VOA41_02000 [Candidatus Dormibacteraeota bacterium]|nr:hypothetical protein [Candidatus Dormibacteraeota bacterium]